MDECVKELLQKAENGTALDRNDLLMLLAFDPRSKEILAVDEVALKIGHRVINDLGFIHGQIGVDNTPCPMNCQFCSFAKINKSNDAENFVLSPETVFSLTKKLSDSGANLVSLMATAALPHKTLLSLVEAARNAASNEVVILVNASDMSLSQTKDLKAAGADAAYHSLRLGEGRLTGIQPSVRLRTIDNIHEAGLALMTGVEPIWSGIPDEEIADAILMMPDLHPVWTGACGLSPAPGTALADAGPLDRDRARQVGALIRMVSQDRIPVGGVGGVIWVDAGTDPRARGRSGDEGSLAGMVHDAQRKLAEDGWQPATQTESRKIIERR